MRIIISDLENKNNPVEQIKKATTLSEGSKVRSNIATKQVARIKVNQFQDALAYLASSTASGYKSLDDLPYKEVQSDWELKDIIFLFNVIHSLGGVLLNLVMIRNNYDMLHLFLTEIDSIFKEFDSYKIIEKEEEKKTWVYILKLSLLKMNKLLA